jgi:pyruvate dehydrogenase E2 component (dihydrolipoamide acetyltransferase)
MSTLEAVTVPKWGMTMTEGTIVQWLVGEGDSITKGDEIVEIETTKLTNVVEASVSGKVLRIVLAEGVTAPVGALAAVVGSEEATEEEIEVFIASYAARAGAGASGEGGGGSRQIEVDGVSVNFLEAGEGEGSVVVLLHGFGGDLSTWMFNQGELAAEFRTVAIDLPGHGASSATPNSDVFDGTVAAVLGVIAEIGAEKVHLVGHSFGGGVAAAVAAHLGARVSSLSLIAPIGLTDSMSGDFLTDFVAADRRRPLQKVLERLVADPSKITAEMVEGTLSFKRLEEVPEALGRLAGAIADGDRQLRDITGELAGLGCPVQLIWGAQDQILPVPAQAPGNARLMIIEEAGHMPQMETASAVNRELVGLMRSAG